MEIWKIITNVILTVIILALTVVVIVDYIKHREHIINPRAKAEGTVKAITEDWFRVT